MTGRTVILSARVDPALDRQARLLAALRGQSRQDVVKSALLREFAAAPEFPEVQRLAAAFSEGVQNV